jgi:hypothetical protein
MLVLNHSYCHTVTVVLVPTPTFFVNMRISSLATFSLLKTSPSMSCWSEYTDSLTLEAQGSQSPDSST